MAYLYPVNTEETINRSYVLSIRGDYWLHALLFFPLPLLVCTAARNAKECFLLTVLCLCIAVAAEGIHYLIPYRSFNPFDMLANVTGIAFSAVFLVLLRRIRYSGK